MKNRILIAVALVAMIGMLTSCGKLPQEKIDAANAAIAAAKTAEADVYVPAEFAELENQMKATMAEIEVQNSKLFKKFGPSIEQLDAIIAKSDVVTQNAAAAKELVKAEVETLMAEYNTALALNKELMVKAPKGKEGKAVLEQMQTELVAIEASFAEANELFNNGMYMKAKDKVAAAKASIDNMNTELQAAIDRVKGRR